jgi:hypothetical protein
MRAKVIADAETQCQIILRYDDKVVFMSRSGRVLSRPVFLTALLGIAAVACGIADADDATARALASTIPTASATEPVPEALRSLL